MFCVLPNTRHVLISPYNPATVERKHTPKPYSSCAGPYVSCSAFGLQASGLEFKDLGFEGLEAKPDCCSSVVDFKILTACVH